MQFCIINLPRNPSTNTTHVRDQRQSVHHGHLYNTQFEAVFNPLSSLDLGTSFEYFKQLLLLQLHERNWLYTSSLALASDLTTESTLFSPSQPFPLILQKQEVLHWEGLRLHFPEAGRGRGSITHTRPAGCSGP